MWHMFSPMPFGAVNLSHRIVLAARSEETSFDFYRQRVSRGGLIIAAVGEIRDEGAASLWRGLADEIHARGGRIFASLGAKTVETACKQSRLAKSAAFDGVELILDLAQLGALEAAAAVWGHGRVGVRPAIPGQSADIARRLGRLGRFFLHVSHSGDLAEIRGSFAGSLLVSADLSVKEAETIVAGRQADLVSFQG